MCNIHWIDVLQDQEILWYNCDIFDHKVSRTLSVVLQKECTWKGKRDTAKEKVSYDNGWYLHDCACKKRGRETHFLHSCFYLTLMFTISLCQVVVLYNFISKMKKAAITINLNSRFGFVAKKDTFFILMDNVTKCGVSLRREH